ncbi:NlpC/P60 family hydrolase [Tetragenococcus koreensis]|uniref:NlpC/P60 family hydrolase n=2 Tax=Tetragenococcus koreensis TaxID=290335 RepID=A0AAN4UC16_9ENTE|nr:NlpC/P60 family hydrolase [Tetragenococcus koreensis]GEQ52105.1 NlpC/P60 family hydrolase [Tetragenococcus koreensis]GEQ54640.1 NlpC/P60 family hydrolase [Tetragenococcus koreensis]GEQ57080.1 NlpC/P60 family hydrolase [Tetragenococcus koreensis]GEQ59672.1 NlpC/P60 family hydrolase [Tetragenococcus koreensis]
MMKKFSLIFALLSFLSFFALLLFVGVVIGEEEDNSTEEEASVVEGEINQEADVSSETLKHQSTVEKYAKKEEIPEHSATLLAIIEEESGGKVQDVMQSSESRGLARNTLDTEVSIEQGVNYFADLLAKADDLGVDDWSVVQAYNYGEGFLNYVAEHGKKYSFEIAENFAKDQSDGEKAAYTSPVATKRGNDWRYNYGNMYYVDLVKQHIRTSEDRPKGQADGASDEKFDAMMDEALKYKGDPYVFGGYTPETSFDCSGLTQWVYKKVGYSIPRVTQDQYEAMDHLSLEKAQPGDLIFFHSTYDAGTYVTHVGIYVGEEKMYHAGDPIGYTDLTEKYWQDHLIGAGRMKD